MKRHKNNNYYQNLSPEALNEYLETLKFTRDFDVYLDVLNRLKSRYAIVMCLKNTTSHNFSEKTVENIHRLGFSEFTAEPDMKYVGIMIEGVLNRDTPMKVSEPADNFEGTLSNTKFFISFLNKEGEIKINGKDCSLNDKGLNIAVYDLKNSQIIDVSCYNAAENNPAFYHYNPYSDEQYINSHIYMPLSFKEIASLPLRKSYFSNRKPGVRELEGGIFLPSQGYMDVDKHNLKIEKYKTYGGVCDEDFNFVAGHKLHNTRDTDTDARHITDSYKAPEKDIVYIDETVLYGGTLIEHPGHLIAECFADRLWWLVQNPDSDIRIAIEIIWNNDVYTDGKFSFVMQFLEAFGISEDRLIIIKVPTKFKKIIIPDQSSIPSFYCFPYEFTSEYIKPFRRITERLTPGNYKKIYLTHSKEKKENFIGEDYFIDFFAKKGFEIIHPEDYTIKEKAELMYGADEVVTLDGTNNLYAVFCKPTVKLTVLTRKMHYWNTPLQQIVEALGIKDLYLVNVSGNFLDNFSGSYRENDTFNDFQNFALGIVLAYATREFKKYVADIYNEEIDITPEEALKKHLYDYLSFFPEYYSEPQRFLCVYNVKMTDILRGMCEVFQGKEWKPEKAAPLTYDERLCLSLERQLQDEKESNAEKVKLLNEKAKGFIDEITSLKAAIAQLEAENEQLRRNNSELSSYMAEISSLLDSLEAQGGIPAE